MTLEPGDILIVSLAETGGPYAAPSPSDWFGTADTIDDATDFAEGAESPAAAYLAAGAAADAIGGRLVRIPANQIPGGA